MAENLNYQTGESWCYGDKENNCVRFGRLYDWNTAKTVCPIGWHLPSGNEWDTLFYACDENKAAGKLLKSKSGWNWNYDDNVTGGGTDAYGFSTLPGGMFFNRTFIDAGEEGFWWTATKAPGGKVNFISMSYFHDKVWTRDYDKNKGFSVRCVQNDKYWTADTTTETDGDTLTDQDEAVEPVFDTLIDERDGKKYRTVKIGSNTWMAENLNYRLTPGTSWCYYDYDNDESMCDKYGMQYDWNTAKTICPNRWYLPSRGEWVSLGEFVGGELRELMDADGSYYYGMGSLYGSGKKLKAKIGWAWDDKNKKSGNGTDSYGFSALPGGRTGGSGGGEADIGSHGFWWSDGDDAYLWTMGYDHDDMYYVYNEGVIHGASVRCVKDSKTGKERMAKEKQRIEKLSVYFTDSRDGRTYRAVKIGGKTWMAENLNYKTKKDASWCYDDDSSICKKFGRLYDWATAKKSCPAGWHLPSRAEWDGFGQAVGGVKRTSSWSDAVDWDSTGRKLKAKNGWDWAGSVFYDNIYSTNGTDDYGFSAMPGGHGGIDTNFEDLGVRGNWWTADTSGNGYAYYRSLRHDGVHLEENYNDKKGRGFSVRCVKD
jgi:uncharacterized protein (TIGR02145 family)